MQVIEGVCEIVVDASEWRRDDAIDDDEFGLCDDCHGSEVARDLVDGGDAVHACPTAVTATATATATATSAAVVSSHHQPLTHCHFPCGLQLHRTSLGGPQ